VRIRLALVVATAALAAGALSAPAALAISATVRAEAATFTAIGATDVAMPAGGGLVTDSDGTELTPTFATALNALGRAADVAGPNVESSAQAAEAVIAAGQNPESGAWKHSGKSAFSYIRSKQASSGLFYHLGTTVATPLLTTAQAIIALQGKTMIF
jgi:hypothetical protein